MTMEDLIRQHAVARPKPVAHASPPKNQTTVEAAAPKPLPPLPQEYLTAKHASPARLQAPSAATRGKKPMSPEIQIVSDKENEQPNALDTLPVVKNTKRAKTAAGTAQPKRTASRTATKEPVSVLSPRSHNSRTLPRSPVKDPYVLPPSPTKSMIARPVGAFSPIRPTSPLKSAATAATSAISASVHGMIEQAKRGGTATAAKLTRTASKEKKELAMAAKGQMLPPPKPAMPTSPQRAFSQTSMTSNSTDISTVSSGTTVVKTKRAGRTAATKPAAVAKSPPAKKKGGVARAASAAKTALKRNAGMTTTATTGKKVVVAEPAVGRRVLRTRA
jgi:hypothetical protein